MSFIQRSGVSIIVATALTAVIGLLAYIFVQVFYPLIGYWTLLFGFLAIFGGSIYYYRLTSLLPINWSLTSYFLNIIIWTGQQLLLGKYIHNLLLFVEQEVTAIFLLATGAFLFGINKAILEELFRLLGVKLRNEMRIGKLLNAIIPGQKIHI